MKTRPQSWRDMSAAPRFFIAVVVLCGTAVLTYSVLHGRSENPLKFFCYLVIALAASRLKVNLPGITGSMSVNFLFLLLGVLELSLSEAMALGCAAVVVQCFDRDRPIPIQVAFNVCSTALAIAVTFAAYRFSLSHRGVSNPSTRLFLAASVYFVANTLPVAAVISLTERKSLRKIWADCYFWSFPYYLVGAGVAGMMSWLHGFTDWQTSLLTLPVVYLIYRSYRLYLGKLEDEKRHVEEMADLHMRTIEALALAIEAKDQTTHDHLQRVRVYAVEVAKELKVDREGMEALQAAALLHDIGKLAIPEHIISKPGRLTPEEFEKMKVHPVVGAEILESVRFPYPVVPIVRAHHEKWDGTGYPYGLKGEEIPIGARIVAAVDCLDALASDRQYRRALPLDEAMRKVMRESGTSFDPKVVDLLHRRYRELERLAHKQEQRTLKLSTDLKIENGLAPAAGFEPSSAPQPPAQPSFIDSIAAARQEFQALLELTHELGSSLRVDETLALLASRLKRLIPHHCIAIYTAEGSRLVARYTSGEDAALFSSLAIPLGEGISGWVVRNNKPIVNGNPSVEPGYLNDPARFSVHRSALSVPLPGIQGVVGALTLYHRGGAAFTKDHLRVLMAVSSKAGLTIENALRFGQAENTPATDALTGLPNTRTMFQRLDAGLRDAVRQGGRLAILVTDMDGFKKINDQFGHATGDLVLQETAKVLKQACRKDDCVARMGGDEFVLLLADAGPHAVGERVRDLDRMVEQTGLRVCGADFLRLSAGAAFYPEDGRDAEELLSKADARMYEMKRRHQGEASPAGSLARLAEALAPGAERLDQLPLSSPRVEC